MANGDEVAAARLAAGNSARARKARMQAKRDAKANALRDPLTVRLAGCGGRTRLVGLDGTMEAHKTPKRAWCGDGAKPQADDIERERIAAAKSKTKRVKRSVRAISSGLPTLGKNR